jgi:predicted phosphodiesterase
MKIETPEKTEIVRDALRKNQRMPSLTLAKMLLKKHPLLFPTIDAARASVNYHRGRKTGRGGKKTKFPIPGAVGSVASRYKMPESRAKAWTPYKLRGRKILVMSDIHIPFHDIAAITAVVKHAKKLKPDVVLLNGDICDFYSISRFDKNPSTSNLLKEIELTRQFLHWIRQEFPKAEIVFKEGNHDEWFDKLLWRKAPELFGIPEIRLQNIITAKRDDDAAIENITWIGDQRRITAGKLTILHGHEMGKGSIAPPVNPARGFFMRALDCTLAGHLHRSSTHNETTMNGKLIACWSTGCLCGLWPDYAKVNKWDHSAAWVEIDNEDFSVNPIRILNGKVL